jgi:hypothetical protein
MMNWYAAHIIMYVKFKDDNQDKYPIWENIVLIMAESDEQAMQKVTERAKRDEGDCEGSFTWEGRPATWCFAGVRKLISCEDPTERPDDGTEISYSEMEVTSPEAFAELVKGEEVGIRYIN